MKKHELTGAKSPNREDNSRGDARRVLNVCLEKAEVLDLFCSNV